MISPEHKELLKDYNNLVDIINETQEMLARLDIMRVEKNELEKKKKLFTVRDTENNIRRMIKAELKRLELRNPKNIAA